MASTDATAIPIKNQAYRVTFPILDADGDLVTAAGALDSEISKDGGTFSDCTNEATEIATSSGVYYLDLTATEMNADTVAVIVKSTGGKTTPIVLYPAEDSDIVVNVQQWNGVSLATTNPLPNAAADAAGGLPISDAGGLDMDAILVDTNSLNDTKIPDTISLAAINAEVDTSMTTYGLDHLVSAAVVGADVTDNSIVAYLASSAATADWDTFVNTTESLQALRDRGDAAWTTGAGTGLTPLASGTAQGGTASTIQLAAGETFADDELNGNSVKITSGTGAGQSRVITDYTGATDTATVAPNWITNPSSDSVYEIVEGSMNVDAWLLNAVTASTGNPDVNVETIDDIDAPATWKASVNAEVDTALVDIGLDHLVSAAVVGADITDNSIIARMAASGATADWDTFVNTTDSLQAIRDHVGDGTNLSEAGGTGDHLTAIPWNASWDVEVESEVNDALVAVHLDHLLAVDYDPAAKPGIATALLNELVESDAGVSRFTSNAVEEVWSAAARTLTAADNITSTGGTTVPQTGDSFARLGAPVGADISADIAAVQSDTDDIQTRIPAVGPVEGTADSGTTTTVVDAALTEADDYWNGMWITFTSGTLNGVTRLITDFDAASDTLTIAPAAPAAVATHTYRITPAAYIEQVNTKTGYAIGTGGITATSFAASAIDAAAVAADAIDLIWDENMEGTHTAREELRLITATQVGKLSGAATTTVTIRDIDDSKDRVTATVDADGNRSAVTTDET